MKRSQIKRRPLADTVLSSLEPEAKEYRELDGNGLYFRVKPDGSKSWQLRYKRPDGKWSWIGLGGHPETSGSLAREKAEQLRADAAAGKNPIASKREREQQALEAANSTFEALALEWHAAKRPNWTEGTATRVLGTLKKNVFPIFGKRSYVSITPMEWLEFLRDLEKTGIIEQTGRIRAICREVYDLALVTGRADHNPLESLHKHLATRKATNYPHVSQDELPALLRAIRNYPHADDVRLGLFLLSRLAVRPGELREARWEEIDLDKALWTIPAHRMKRRREHVVPLPKQAIEALQQLHKLTGYQPLVFPGRSDKTAPRSNTVFVMALRRLGYQGRQTGHGFRHIASTILNEHGFNADHIEAQLSHVKEGVAGVYNKAQYIKQRRHMMQWYADHLEALERGNVVELEHARRA
ncbi:tyrosine-type recombinase/integrase [Halomonas daqingensis]|uniref:Tyrosine-type recombinase/integrase n=1 Tax=Billgrantia desiderata TaxID=52021 RepID=A0AAW4YZZ2_9GAMM|nr:tyrosine-type recombinase/integrase [Halomonas desiderata]MCE8053185.1 tyrosine-type recombinase/integrase [Halomonas desiderata]